jgi:low temperature requirement protein LtrA
VNWGDLFFDLFYVSAFYNLSYMYKYEVSTANIVYFFGCFGPIMTNWMDKTHYTARFEAPNDAVHRVLEVR